MEIKTTETTLEFDVFKTLTVIENDLVLDEIFRGDDTNMSYSLLRTMAKHNTLSSDLLDRITEIFERVILLKPKYINEYQKLNTIDISVPEEPKKTRPSKYYGKQRILKDVELNDGKLTELDRALLALNTLRNITARLRARGKNDKLCGTKKLSDIDCRDIVAAVRIVENKVNNILKNK
jgi:hypothetical protein